MIRTKPLNTPMHTFEILSKDENDKKVYQMIYKVMIEYMLYLTSSRLELMHNVCLCARF